MIHPPPTKTLLTATFEPLVRQLSGSLARGARPLEPLVQSEPTPQQTVEVDLALSELHREAGRRIMAWALHQLEPEADDKAPLRVEFEGRLSRRRPHPHSVAALLGPVVLRRRLYEPLGRRGRCLHPFELRVGIEAGFLTPALAESAWAAAPPITSNRRSWRG